MNRKLGIIGSSEVGSGHLSGACSARIPDPLGSWERQQEYHPDRSVNTNTRTVYRRNKYASANSWSAWVRDVTADDLDAKSPLDTTLIDNAASSTLPTTTSGSLVSKIQQIRDYLKYLLNSVNSISGDYVSTTLSNFTSKFLYKYSTVDGVNLWTQIASFTVAASTTYNFGIEFSMSGDDYPWSSSPINMYVTIRDTFIDVCGICTSNKASHIEVYYGISNGVAKVYLRNWSNWVTAYAGVILYDSHGVVNFSSSSTTAPASGYTNIYTFATNPRIVTAAVGSITNYTDGVIYLEY